ncbi:MAG: hypothetical protein I8H91_14490 [Burkholderiales bacterium]|nr:hypothetical protein [Burkholderiales bacterium]
MPDSSKQQGNYVAAQASSWVIQTIGNVIPAQETGFSFFKYFSNILKKSHEISLRQTFSLSASPAFQPWVFRQRPLCKRHRQQLPAKTRASVPSVRELPFPVAVKDGLCA